MRGMLLRVVRLGALGRGAGEGGGGFGMDDDESGVESEDWMPATVVLDEATQRLGQRAVQSWGHARLTTPQGWTFKKKTVPSRTQQSAQ